MGLCILPQMDTIVQNRKRAVLEYDTKLSSLENLKILQIVTILVLNT